jgi:Beta-lactamase superfamily domain
MSATRHPIGRRVDVTGRVPRAGVDERSASSRAGVRFTLLGVGAMNSPRYRPAGLLVAWRHHRVMFDGGDEATPAPPLDAWLVCDARAELIADICRRGRALHVEPGVAQRVVDGVEITPMPVVHTSHPTYGYLIRISGYSVAWAPEFMEFPAWAAGADLMFADAAGWRQPVRFAGGAGGHACVFDTADMARRYAVKRLVFGHIGRPVIRARDAGEPLPYGEWGYEGHVYRIGANPSRSAG